MDINDIRIILTEDGSHTLHLSSLNETYHSIHGAIQESNHIFIRHGLQYAINNSAHKELGILEVGFGTGLNALLTYYYCKNHPGVYVKYTTLEPFPLPEDIIQKLNFYEQEGMEKIAWDSIHKASWNKPVELLPNFTLSKLNMAIENFETGNTYDLVYFDAFAPGKQPEIWGEDVFKKIYALMDDHSVLVTYCAQGQFKRILRNTGFVVEALPGPPGKMEMTRAIKIEKGI